MSLAGCKGCERHVLTADSGSTNNPVLRFLLFVPSAAHRPMRLSVPGKWAALAHSPSHGRKRMNALMCRLCRIVPHTPIRLGISSQPTPICRSPSRIVPPAATRSRSFIPLVHTVALRFARITDQPNLYLSAITAFPTHPALAVPYADIAVAGRTSMEDAYEGELGGSA